MADEDDDSGIGDLLDFGGGGPHRGWLRNRGGKGPDGKGDDDRAALLLAPDEPVPDEPDLWGPFRAFLLRTAQRLDRSRVAMVAAAVMTVIALTIALVGWMTRPDTAAAGGAGSASLVATHGLTQNQAACLGYAQIEQRMAAATTAPVTHPSRVQRDAWRTEVGQLDRLAPEYPASDFHLVIAFHDVADISVEMLAATSPREIEDLASHRLAFLSLARRTCALIGGFNVRRMAPVQNPSSVAVQSKSLI